jgi:CheY-like chemotaxis protein
VVDDDPDIIDALADVLTGAGYEVVSAGHGGEALEYLRKHAAPALILLDLFMPVMNGWEFLQQFEKDPALAPIPVIVISASREPWSYLRRKDLVLRKPLQMDLLLAAVREATKSAGA